MRVVAESVGAAVSMYVLMFQRLGTHENEDAANMDYLRNRAPTTYAHKAAFYFPPKSHISP